jgi:hypothetical protein
LAAEGSIDKIDKITVVNTNADASIIRAHHRSIDMKLSRE